jgi:tetratricopeptide (TPR) repeat protein
VLFDLRGKRRRLVQVSFAMLALLFLVGFLGFGIGVGGGPGGIFDALGISNSGGTGGSSTSAIQDEIDAANEKLAKDPNDTKALLKLAQNEYLLGRSGVETDPTTGQPTAISNEAHTDFGQAADAWSKYLKVNKGDPDVTTAFNMVNVYILLGDAEGATQAQEIIAKDQPSAQSYGQLAFLQYLSGDLSGGDASREKALDEASKTQAKTLEPQLDQARKQGEQIKKQQEQAQKQGGKTPTAPGTNPLENPFGGLGTTPP